MNNNHKISHSLIELSDAIEQLAMIIAKENGVKTDKSLEQLELVVDKFKKSTKNLAEPETKEPADILSKYKEGYLEDWLIERNLYVGKSITGLHVDKRLSDIAEYLSDHYYHLSDFYSHLKKSQSIKSDFKMRTTKQSFKYIRKWCNMLHSNKIIDAFHSLDDENSVDVDIATIYEATNFINGQWLEILLRKEIATLLVDNADKIDRFDILAQINFVKPNRTASEIDLLLMLNDKVYWFECKSGHIGEHYFKRFLEHKRHFELPTEQCILVVPASQIHQRTFIRERAGMDLYYGTKLEEQLKKLLFFYYLIYYFISLNVPS